MISTPEELVARVLEIAEEWQGGFLDIHLSGYGAGAACERVLAADPRAKTNRTVYRRDGKAPYVIQTSCIEFGYARVGAQRSDELRPDEEGDVESWTDHHDAFQAGRSR